MQLCCDGDILAEDTCHMQGSGIKITTIALSPSAVHYSIVISYLCIGDKHSTKPTNSATGNWNIKRKWLFKHFEDTSSSL